MSTETRADIVLEEAKTNIQFAIEKLSEIVINKCYGYDEFSVDYRNKIATSFNVLLSIRDNLDV